MAKHHQILAEDYGIRRRFSSWYTLGMICPRRALRSVNIRRLGTGAGGIPGGRFAVIAGSIVTDPVGGWPRLLLCERPMVRSQLGEEPVRRVALVECAQGLQMRTTTDDSHSRGRPIDLVSEPSDRCGVLFGYLVMRTDAPKKHLTPPAG